MEKFEGFLWKRAPRETDTDKKRIRRLFGPGANSKSLYKLRYISLDMETNMMTYHSDKSKSDTLGAVDISTATEVVLNHMEDEAVPSQWPINLITPSRVWILYAETMEIRDEWTGRFRVCMHAAAGVNPESEVSRGDGLTRSGSMSPPMSGVTSKTSSNETTDRGSVKVAPRPRKGTLLFGGRTASTDMSPAASMNISEQTRQVSHLRLQSACNLYTGNLPIDALSVFSLTSYHDMDFVDMMRSWCSHGKSSSLSTAHVKQHVLDKCIYELSPTEGDTLVHQGERFQYVYFVIRGELLRRKDWAGTHKSIGKPVPVGKCAGDIECLLLDGISPTTLLIGPNTAYMKLKRQDFVREFELASGTGGRHGIFAERFMDEEVGDYSLKGCFPQRYKRYSFDILSCHPLFEKHPKESVEEMAGLFYPLCFRAGQVLIREEDESNEFFLVVEGSCNVFKRNLRGENELVHSTRSGDWLGEAGLFRNSRRNATVEAFTDVVVLKTDAKGFRRFIDNGGPNVRRAVERSVTNHMASSIRGIPLFHDLGDDVIESICVCMSVRELQADSVLVASGSVHDEFFVIMHGHVNGSIQRSGEFSFKKHPPVVDVVGENDFFGEGWVLQSKYSTEVTYATPDSRVVALSSSVSEFKAIVDGCPTLRLRLEERLNSRRSRLEMTHSLTAVISNSLELVSSSPTKHFDDEESVASAEAIDAELTYLRAEVARLGGNPFQHRPGKKAMRKALQSNESITSLSLQPPSPETTKSLGRTHSMRLTKENSSSGAEAVTPTSRSKSPGGRFRSLFGLGGSNSKEGSTRDLSSTSTSTTPIAASVEPERRNSANERRSSVREASRSVSSMDEASSRNSSKTTRRFILCHHIC